LTLYILQALMLCQYDRSHIYHNLNKLNIGHLPQIDIVKPVLRSHPYDKEKWTYKTGDILKEIHFI